MGGSSMSSLNDGQEKEEEEKEQKEMEDEEQEKNDKMLQDKKDDSSIIPAIEELDDNELSNSLLHCLNGNSPDEDQETNPKTRTTSISLSLSLSSSSTSSSSVSFREDSTFQQQLSQTGRNPSSSTKSSSTITTTTNRLSTNPFVILNKVRKRAATAEFEKIASKVFHDHITRTDDLSSSCNSSSNSSSPSDNTVDEFRILMEESSGGQRENSFSGPGSNFPRRGKKFHLTEETKQHHQQQQQSPGETNF